MYAITYKRRNDEVTDVQEENAFQKGAVKLKYVPTKEQVADVLTKPLACIKFEILSRQAWCSPKGPLSKEGVTTDIRCGGE